MNPSFARWSFSLVTVTLAVAATTPALGAAEEVEITLGGYVQAQYEGHATSEDQLSESDGMLNQDRFLIRRARLRLAADTEYLGGYLEFSGGTRSGSLGVSLHRAEGRLRYRPSDEGLPSGQLFVGLTKIPFGYSLADSSTRRFFMERPLVVRSFFPGSTDLGAVLRGDYRWLNLHLGLMNGEPRGGAVEFSGTDPNSAKDFLAKLGADSGKTSAERPFRISGHVSFLTGTGFSPGEEGAPSRNYDRWAAGADLQLEYLSGLGATILMGEVLFGENMDRNHFPADPIADGVDSRQLGWYAALTQELGDHLIAGLRYDVYEPDSRDDRESALVPANMRVQTITPMVGLILLEDLARLTFQYEFIRDDHDGGEDASPANLVDDVWTIRFQVRL